MPPDNAARPALYGAGLAFFSNLAEYVDQKTGVIERVKDDE
jgi:hypothetical protein